jgi:putative oxidoreductase
MSRYLRPVWEDRLLSVMRIATGVLYMEHGTAKVLDFPHQATHIPYPAAIFTLTPGLSGAIELIGGFLLAIGLFTRPTAFILSGQMAVAYFMGHATRGFFPLLNAGELAVVYCFVFLFFSAAGGGVWSLDRSRGAEDPA